MDKLVENSIVNSVFSIEDSYIEERISKIERTTDWNADLYLSLRYHLLKEKGNQSKLIQREIGDRRDQYLQTRFHLLESKYHKKSKVSSNKNKPTSPPNTITAPATTSTTTTTTTTTTSKDNIKKSQSQIQQQQPTQSLTVKVSNNNVSTSSPIPSTVKVSTQQLVPPPPTTSSSQIALNDYSFSGMHHIFDSHKKAITRIKFANNDRDLLAFSSDDGTVSVCKSLVQPSVIFNLNGHNGAPVTDFIWSNNNEYLITISIDSQMIIWNTKSGKPEKQIKDCGVCSCIASHPTKSTLIFVSDNKNLIKYYDMKSAQWSSKPLKAMSIVTAMHFESRGNYLFTGESNGYINIYNFKESLIPVSKLQISQLPITSLSSQYWKQGAKLNLSILANSKDNSMRVINVTNLQSGIISVVRVYDLNTKSNQMIKSIFCPSIKDRDGLYCVSGTNNGALNIYDTQSPKKAPLNQLIAHASAITDVSWNSDESLLASADSTGTVILWKHSRFNNI